MKDSPGQLIRDRFNKSQRRSEIDWVPPEDQDGGDKEDLVSQTVAGINKDHALVYFGGKTAIIHEEIDFKTKNIIAEFKTVGAVKQYNSNKFTLIKDDEGRPKRVLSFDLWMQSPDRRDYKKVVFDPNYIYPKEDFYNLFCGYGGNITPKQGDCQHFLQHILNAMCHRNENHFKYIMRWFQQAYMDPGGKRPGVALAMVGEPGCGKGIIMDGFGPLFAPHYLHLTDGNVITGQFNKLLQHATMVFADEVVFAGDARSANRLKGLITEDTIQIQPKHLDTITVDNHMRVVFASNNRHILRVEPGDRRYAIFEFDNSKANDREYFGKILKEREDGGVEALLYELLNFKGTEIDIRSIPETAAREEQKNMTLAGDTEGFWHHRLSVGTLFDSPNSQKEEDMLNQIIEDSLRFGGMAIEAKDLYLRWLEGTYIRKQFLYDQFEKYSHSNGNKFPVGINVFWKITTGKGEGRSVFITTEHCRVLRKGKSRTGMFVPGELEVMRLGYSTNISVVDWGAGEEVDPSNFEFTEFKNQF